MKRQFLRSGFGIRFPNKFLKVHCSTERHLEFIFFLIFTEEKKKKLLRTTKISLKTDNQHSQNK